ncbi:unnamed protein product [Heligmosomoides polygyrus]|uniref:Uncharacterized protein n=1 Tax=Heligmosomoides polygyrus TaxID=6339 RepID=A0A183G3E8_HELPZ|nr:unnamed protein product [Heligmosomoides polygyrus]
MTLFVSLERGGSIGPLCHSIGTNGDAAGARSSKSMINGTTGDTVDEDGRLEVVEEDEEDWDPQDELMDVERQASSGHMITFSGGTLVSEERVRLQLDFGCVLITMEEDTAIHYAGALYWC